MISILIIVLSVFIAIAYFFRSNRQASPGRNWLAGRHFWVAIFIAIGGIFISAIQPFELQRVDAGSVGIQASLVGDSRGIGQTEYKNGWIIINTWTAKLYEYPVSQQHVEYPKQQVITKGGFPVDIAPSFNYSLKSGSVADMFTNLRVDIKIIEQEWLKTAIVGTVNDIANRWTPDSVFNQREAFEANIVAECNHKVSKWFNVSQLRTNITPPKELMEAIINKTKAVQDEQVAESQRRVAVANGFKQIAEAKADSAEQVIRASAAAREIQLKQVALTPQYLEYLKINKWNGENSQTVLGGGTSTMVNVK